MARNASTSAILGKFDGECADANITNLNGLDITREVWENVFDSDEYKKAIELGHLIGFLGHPEDPACQDFEHACIVMTSGYIDSDGKVYGSFNLVDTPVGRIVKSFIDAGVTFGISVRGAGDIINNSVDPDTFIFRGFDLVTFPAYPDSIPKFTPVAASSDATQQQKYKNVCAAVHNNIDRISSVGAIEVMKTCVAAQSDPYKELEQREGQLTAAKDPTLILKKLDAITNMYIEASRQLRETTRNMRAQSKTFERRSRRIKEIMSSQLRSLESKLDSVEQDRDTQVARLNRRVAASVQKQKELEKSNLIYNQKLDAAQHTSAQHAAKHSEMQAKVAETVEASEALQSKLSNLDTENRRLRAELSSIRSSLSEYQTAYAQLYSMAVGGDSNVSITASTSVEELAKKIRGSRTVVTATCDDTTEFDVVSDDLTTL